jgi:hypothetical protein
LTAAALLVVSPEAVPLGAVFVEAALDAPAGVASIIDDGGVEVVIAVAVAVAEVAAVAVAI